MLGLTLHHQGRLAEAKRAYRAGIALDPEPGMADVGLRRIFADLEETPLPVCALSDDQRANEDAHPGLRVWNRPVESGPLDTLYGLGGIDPETEKISGLTQDKYSSGIREGNVRFSDSFKLFDADNPGIGELPDGIVTSVSTLLNSDVFVVDSFFNIHNAGSTINRHNHLTERQ